MKKLLLLFSVIISGNSYLNSAWAQTDEYSVTLFNDVVFYDGYAATVDEPVPDGVTRINNTIYTTKLTNEMLNSFGNTLEMDFTLGALCDNYDRIARINLAFVPKGATEYDRSEVNLLELGRFITPFMNKNIDPTEVPYTFQVDNIAAILTNEGLRAEYDFWIEIQVFGVPYAAQEQVAGCAGRNDTFSGTLVFKSSTNPNINNEDEMTFIPLIFNKRMNNYGDGATDVEGETIKIKEFHLDEPVENAKFFVITSNHGANQGGEEYNLRDHFIYLNDELVYQYKPGGESCEPFRQYNTQGNGIYGPNPRTDAQWASFSNWCPGDVIPLREIDLGNLPAGDYTFKIDVPDAQFVNNEGYIPLSVYFQNRSSTHLSTRNYQEVNNFAVYPNPSNSVVYIDTTNEVNEVTLFDVTGKKVWHQENTKALDLQDLVNGLYIAKIELSNGSFETAKIVKK